MTSERPKDLDDRLDEAAAMLRDASNILFITGAGISADSGLPTYRGIGGLYDDAATDEGIPIELALSGPMFRVDPGLTWKHIRDIEEACRGAQPNDAHRRIVEFEAERDRVWVLTQNVDGLHRRAGSRNLIEIHGTIHELHCTQCEYDTAVADYSGLDPLPRCPECGAVVRPRVVLFQEMLPSGPVRSLERELLSGFDVVVSIGTTSVFPYIAQPVYLARRSGKPTIEINPGTSEVSADVDVKLALGAAEALRELWARTR